MDRPAFAAAQQRLLQLERQAEIAEAERILRTRSDAELQARGTTLLRLQVADLEPGFGGRLHAVLQPSRAGPLPAHRFGPGDVVAVREARERAPVTTAVVVRARPDTIVVALDDEDADLPPLVRLDQLVTDVTFRRLDAAVRDLAVERRGEAGRLTEVLFGEREPEFGARPLAEELRWFDPALDPSQRDAVLHALRAEHVALIHGPPGTGKTTAVVELVRQAVARGDRVLACAPSNVAVDNLAERLAAAGVRVVRLGHPARIAANVRDVSLAALVDGAPEQKILRDVRREVDQGLRAVHKAKTRQDRHAARGQVRQLRRELRQIESALTRGYVDGAEVVLATNVGAADPLLAEFQFDLAVIDEAAQALEAACWIPLRLCRRIVFAGDHRQLPPTIQSREAELAGLGRTLFERLAESPHGGAMARLLTVQYRMHERIMGWPSARFYAGRIAAAPAVRSHLLTDLPGVVTNEWTGEPLCFVDTAGCGHDETPGDDDGSRSNPGEAGLVVKIVTALREANVPAGAIAVITPYNAQVQLLRDRLAHEPELEIGTVDGLQGREKEAVVVSLVRSNEAGEVGFLAELRRLNVALTRARRHLTVVGDSATLAHDHDLMGLVEHLQAHSVYRSAFELG
ncbi:MAG: IGHMBP2 family helicase [Planctomycetes bacterium]|nr:IGHMBP2 family helicase [Planctomycetota bacterium]